MDKICNTCRFFVEGRCRRYPPQRILALAPYGIGVAASSKFPETKPEWFCGEHRP